MNIKKSWNKVAKQYSKLITQRRGTYHQCLVPAIIDIICLKERGGVKVLDVGCGDGYLTNLLSKRGCNVIGVDISGELIKLAHQKYQNLNFLEANASVISTKVKGEFDVIVSNFAVHDMKEEDFKLFLLATKKKLVKGGLLVFSIPHPCFYNKSSLDYFSNQNSQIEIKDYKNSISFNKNLGEGVNVKHFHRTLDWYFNSCFFVDYQCVGFKEVFDKNNIMFKYIPYGIILSFEKSE